MITIYPSIREYTYDVEVPVHAWKSVCICDEPSMSMLFYYPNIVYYV
jgi:hypothetical protein